MVQLYAMIIQSLMLKDTLQLKLFKWVQIGLSNLSDIYKSKTIYYVIVTHRVAMLLWKCNLTFLDKN